MNIPAAGIPPVTRWRRRSPTRKRHARLRVRLRLAAISTVLELLDKDSHLVAVDDVYGGTYRLLENVRRRSAGLQVSWVKPDDRRELKRRSAPIRA